MNTYFEDTTLLPMILTPPLSCTSFPWDRDFLNHVAQAVIAENSSILPDLSQSVVIVPTWQLAHPLKQELIAASGLNTLLLPQIMPLDTFIKPALPELKIVSKSQQLILLYNALRQRFESNSLWTICHELVDLFALLTRYRVALPQNEKAFVQQLEKIYQTQSNQALQFEARLVHELWFAMNQDGALDEISVQHLKLHEIARKPKQPLYLITVEQLIPAQEQFLQDYCQQQPVHIFSPDISHKKAKDISHFLNTVWQSQTKPEKTQPSINERISQWHEIRNTLPSLDHLRFYGATSLENEAQAAATQIIAWLSQNQTATLAIIALDRLIARRLRALLERHNIFIEDESGWKLSTTSACSVIARWLDSIANDFYYRDLLDFFKSPFAFADLDNYCGDRAERLRFSLPSPSLTLNPSPRGRGKLTDSPRGKSNKTGGVGGEENSHGCSLRQIMVYSLEARIRKDNIVAGINCYKKALFPSDEGLKASFARLEQAARYFQGKHISVTLSQWLDKLTKSLQILGVIEGLNADLAGQQVINVIQRWQAELQNDVSLVSFSEWRRWLNSQFESETFVDNRIQSPLRMMDLGATRLRSFDYAILLGADASNLPGSPTTQLFNQSVRAQLGIPTHEYHVEQMRQNLIGLISCCKEILVTWRATKDGYPNLLSPFFECLKLTLPREASASASMLFHPNPSMQETPSIPSTAPAPRVPKQLIPSSISASGYNSLMACPYQFYARYMLGLNELDEVKEQMEKRDYGELVHSILFNFHRQFPDASAAKKQQLQQALIQITQHEFTPAIETNYLAMAWKLRWENLIPLYLDWFIERSQNGWKWHAGELNQKKEIMLSNGEKITLKGRIDRIDQKQASQSETMLSVIDYKTGNVSTLKKRMNQPGEEVQLPFYTVLTDIKPVEVSYLCLEKDKITPLLFKHDLYEAGEAVLERLQILFEGLFSGQPLPAQGVEEVCQFCEMGGVCRKDYWGTKEIKIL